MHLLVEHGWLHCEPREVEVGTHGLELVLGATGGVAGRVLLDPGVPAGLAIELRQRGTRAVVGSSATKKDGSFECRRVPVGTYALAVARDGEVLSEVHDVVVLANEVAGDPRLAALDLRGRMHVFRIELVPPSPGFELNGSLRYMEAGAAGQGYARDFGSQQAPLEVLTSLPRIDAVLRVAGCRVERLADLGPRTEVRLRTGYPVRLALPVGVRLPAPPLFLGVALAGQDAGPLAEGAAFFDERGEAVIHAAEAGRATIAWVWERRRENGGMRAGLELPAQSFIEIEDRPGEQRFELALTNEALATALKAR